MVKYRFEMENSLSLNFHPGRLSYRLCYFTFTFCQCVTNCKNHEKALYAIRSFLNSSRAYRRIVFISSFVLDLFFSNHERIAKTETTDFHDASTWQLQLKMTGYCKFSCSTFFLQVPEVFSAKLSCPCYDMLWSLQSLQGKDPLYCVPICKDSLCYFLWHLNFSRYYKNSLLMLYIHQGIEQLQINEDTGFSCIISVLWLRDKWYTPIVEFHPHNCPCFTSSVPPV